MLYTVIPHERIYGETEYDRLYNKIKEEKEEVLIPENPIACGKIELTALSQVDTNTLDKCLEIEEIELNKA